jgi:hypothetical protein
MNYVAMAKKELKDLQKLVKGMTFKDVISLFEERKETFRIIDDEYIDIDLKTSCITIKNDNGNALVLTGGVEIYDKNGMLFGVYNF